MLSELRERGRERGGERERERERGRGTFWVIPMLAYKKCTSVMRPLGGRRATKIPQHG